MMLLFFEDGEEDIVLKVQNLIRSVTRIDYIKSLSYGMTSFMIRINPNPLPTGARFGFIRCGGDGGNRTRVRKRVTGAFYERSFCFKLPAARRPKAGFWLW